MPAAYDTYDYPQYWENREYEHQSEIIAIKSLLERIHKIETILDIGSGYSRLTPTYLFRAKKIILTDPSSCLLKIAREKYKDNRKIKFVQSKVENLDKKIKTHSIDLVVMVRVVHHLEDSEKALQIISKLLKPNGYLLLEFPNKGHFKATMKEFFVGNFTFPLDIFPKDLRSKKAIKNKTLPFINYHPDIVVHKLKDYGFRVLEKRSVSNIRFQGLKNTISLPALLSLEKYLQKPFSYINFGPSIFLLAQKRG